MDARTLGRRSPRSCSRALVRRRRGDGVRARARGAATGGIAGAGRGARPRHDARSARAVLVPVGWHVGVTRHGCLLGRTSQRHQEWSTACS